MQFLVTDLIVCLALKDRGSDGMQKQLDTISKLTGKVEHYEMELKIAEDRCGAVNAQLETQVILCRDREKQVLQLQEEVNEKQCCIVLLCIMYFHRVVKNALFLSFSWKQKKKGFRLILTTLKD